MNKSLEQNIESLLQLSKSEKLHEGKFKDFIAALIPVAGNALSAYKASFWLYRSENDEFESIHSFDAETNNSSKGEVFDPTQFSIFYSRIKKELLIQVQSADESEEVSEFAIDYLMKNGLKSWASVQVWNDNRLFGALTFEWKNAKGFSHQDQLIMITCASIFSQCYYSLFFLKEDFLHRNELDSLKTEEKEKEKLAKKLSDHAFYTSHNIRHPLSTILALIDLIKLNWENREAYEELLQQLKIETMNLDDAIRVMTAKIELD